MSHFSTLYHHRYMILTPALESRCQKVTVEVHIRTYSVGVSGNLIGKFCFMKKQFTNFLMNYHLMNESSSY